MVLLIVFYWWEQRDAHKSSPCVHGRFLFSNPLESSDLDFSAECQFTQHSPPSFSFRQRTEQQPLDFEFPPVPTFIVHMLLHLLCHTVFSVLFYIYTWGLTKLHNIRFTSLSHLMSQGRVRGMLGVCIVVRQVVLFASQLHCLDL